MMILKAQSRASRKDGTTPKTMTLRERARKYGKITSEETISNRRDLLISGPQAAGKSRWIAKLEAQAAGIWGKRAVITLAAVDPLSKWADRPELEQYAIAVGKKWSGAPAHTKVETLAEYIRDKKAVLILDDTHKLTGRKLAVATRCAEAAHLVVSTTIAEQATPITLRLMLDRRNPTRVDLSSDAAYDSTSVVMWLVILISLGAGAWQLAAVLGGLKFLAGGRGANKQN